MLIGIDTGGTFTDFVVLHGGGVEEFKLSTDHLHPERVVAEGVEQILATYPEACETIEIFHGTTLGTNLLLEGKGARTALVTTKGFKDIVEIGRQNRSDLYSFKALKPKPPVDREHRHELNERMLHTGEAVIIPTDPEIEVLAGQLGKDKIEAVAVCFLNSYRNPDNEKYVGEVLARSGFHVSESADLAPVYREYERFILAAMNARIGPFFKQYLEELERLLPRMKIQIVQSNGGTAPIGMVKKKPIHTVLSGPSAGVLAASAIGKTIGKENLLTFDMGGTSTDVSLYDRGFSFTDGLMVGGLPLGLNVVNIETIGAGGGSIVTLNKALVLKVGPESAGSVPGPMCYGCGHHLTVTDANVVTGRINPETFYGGKRKLKVEPVVLAFRELGRTIGRTTEEVAEGVIDIVNTMMAGALKKVSAGKGADPSDYILLGYGGGGGLHAVDLASRLGMHEVIFPPHTSVFSAFGLIQAKVTRDITQTVMLNPRRITYEQLDRFFGLLEKKILKEFDEENLVDRAKTDIIFARSLFIQYAGQGYPLEIPCDRLYLQRFHLEHKRLYGFEFPDKATDIVNLRIRAVLGTSDQEMSFFQEVSSIVEAGGLTRKKIFLGGSWQDVRTIGRASLPPGETILGPALVEEAMTTLLIPEGWHFTRDRYDCVVVTKENPREVS